MSKQFTAHIPARTLKGQTKSFSYPARDDAYTCDDAGQWSGTRMGEIVKMDDASVIDACKSASRARAAASVAAWIFPLKVRY